MQQFILVEIGNREESERRTERVNRDNDEDGEGSVEGESEFRGDGVRTRVIGDRSSEVLRQSELTRSVQSTVCQL